MAQHTGGNGAFTPSTTNDNWTLHADTAGDIFKVKKYGWGGRGTTSTGYRTRWTRPATDPTGAGTAIVQGRTSPGTVALCALNSTYATAQAILTADPGGNLDAMDWNILGGGGEIVLPIGGEWTGVNAATAGFSFVSCRNVAGVDANLSTYSVQWEE